MSMIQLTQKIHLIPTSLYTSQRQPVQPMLPGLEPSEPAQPTITNRQIAEVLSSLANLLEFQNSNPYRVQAYRNAARGILDLQMSVATLVHNSEKLPIPGLGRRLQSHIVELVQTGSLTFYHDLCLPALSPSVRALMAVEHIGPRTAIRLYEELGVDSVEKLWNAAHQQQIRKLPGFGIRSEARLLQAASRILERGGPLQSLHGAA